MWEIGGARIIQDRPGFPAMLKNFLFVKSFGIQNRPFPLGDRNDDRSGG